MTDRKQEIIDLEHRFWDSMKAKDADTAAAMIADPSIVVGPMGTMTMNPEIYARMTREGQWTLSSYTMDDVDVVFPNDDTAVIGYKVRQQGDMKGQPMDLHCADSTVWVRDGDDWKCALHTETILDTAKQPEPA